MKIKDCGIISKQWIESEITNAIKERNKYNLGNAKDIELCSYITTLNNLKAQITSPMPLIMKVHKELGLIYTNHCDKNNGLMESEGFKKAAKEAKEFLESDINLD